MTMLNAILTWYDRQTWTMSSTFRLQRTAPEYWSTVAHAEKRSFTTFQSLSCCYVTALITYIAVQG